ncbi:MAG: PTS sugar transporter subunit IIA, partial [Spirochaetota bacterium]
NPGSATGLLSLAFLLRPRGTASSFRATVVCEDEGNEREMERAENLLAQAMVAARDANLSLTPSMVTAPSVAEGLIEAGAGLSSSTVILGWNRAPQTATAFSAGIAETLLARTDALVVVARPGRGFEGVDRLTLVLPPGVEKREDAEKVASLIGGMLAASGAGLTVLVQKPGGARARSLLASLRPRGGIEIEELDSWKQAAKSSRARSRAASSNRPAYVVLCGRPGSVGWHPSFDSLPRDFAAAFPESPLVVIYPPTMDESMESTETKLGLFDEALEGGRVMVSMSEAAITDAIRRLLATGFDTDRKTLVRLSSLFTGIAQKEAIELEPGVILLHAHVPDVSTPLLFFGASSTPWRLLALDEPVRVLVILCAPEGQGPKRHLATLGELARLFKDGSLGKRLAEAKEVGEFRGGGEERGEG